MDKSLISRPGIGLNVPLESCLCVVAPYLSESTYTTVAGIETGLLKVNLDERRGGRDQGNGREGKRRG